MHHFDHYSFDRDFPPRPSRVARYPILRASTVFSDIYDMLADARQHMVFYATLSQKHSLIDMHLAHAGPLTTLPLQPRAMFRQAIIDGAASIALLQNHPCKDPHPSEGEEEVNEQLCIAGDLLGIAFFDHIIVAGQRSFSFYDTGLI